MVSVPPSFNVVEFTKEKTVSVVPREWMYNESLCHWPNVKTGITQLIKNHTEPFTKPYSWITCECRILAEKIGSYAEAKRKEKESEYYSDIPSDGTDEDGSDEGGSDESGSDEDVENSAPINSAKRKKRPKRKAEETLFVNVESLDDAEPLNVKKISRTKRRKPNDQKLILTQSHVDQNAHTDNTSLHSSEITPTSQVSNPLVKNTSEQPITGETPEPVETLNSNSNKETNQQTDDSTTDNNESQSKNLTEEEFKNLWNTKSEEEKLLFVGGSLYELRKDMKSLKVFITKSGKSGYAPASQNTATEISGSAVKRVERLLPLRSEGGWKLLEEKLLNDEEFRIAFKAVASTKKSSDVGETVRKVTALLFSDTYLKDHTMTGQGHGQGQKLKIKGAPKGNLILSLVSSMYLDPIRKTPTITEEEVNKPLSAYVLHVGDRIKNRAKAAARKEAGSEASKFLSLF